MEVQRTSSEAVGCIAPTRLTRSGPDRTEIPQCSGPLPSRRVLILNSKKARIQFLLDSWFRADGRSRWATGAARGERARAAVPGRLVEHAVAMHGFGECRRVGVFRQLEGIEAGALQ